MSQYSEFFFNSPASTVALETLEISHPSFSQTYYIVRNAMNGLNAKTEDGVMRAWTYYPLSIKKSGAADDLDQTLQIQLGDLGAIIPGEIDRCRKAGTLLTKPIVTYRTFRSDDLTAPMDGPFFYELPGLATKRKNTAFTAQAPRLSNSRTGEIYNLTRFPMLSGVL